VAIKAAEVAANLLSTNATVAQATVTSNAENRKALQAIHVLVNSNLLAAQRSELIATQASLKSMREVVALKTRLGVPVLPETLAALEKVEAQVAALALDIVYKEQATLLADTIILDHGTHRDPTLPTEGVPVAG
jgi:2-succinyl-5-enolpyruvyl-6-hydroxy-3-cyclohexene-1-carboxylate synthase